MIDELVTIENRASVISVIENEIINVFIKPDLEFEIPDVDDISQGVQKLGNGNKSLILVDVSENTTGNSEVREYSSKNGANKYATATAFLTHSLAQKIVVNFFISLYRKDKPSRMFTNKENAVEWLRKFSQ